MSMDTMIQVFRDNVVGYHDVPLTIVLDRDTRFTLKSWKDFHKEMRIQLKFSTTFHSQMDGHWKG